MPIKKADAVTSNAQTTDIGNILYDDYQTRDKKFDGEQLGKLYSQITGIANATYSDVLTAAIGTKTSADFRSTENKQTGGKLITLTIDGMEWNAVYLSTNRDKEPILTLWLANSSETADFNYHSVNQNSIIPSNMYSTSMIRTVTLNNEGTWYETNTGNNPHKVTPKADHKYAKFTMTEEQGVVGSIADFIDAPSNVEWQEKLISHKHNAYQYDYNNDAYGDVGSGGGDNANWDNGHVNYFGKTDYSAWQNDKLWLPAMAESGWEKGGYNGLWNTSELERGNADGISTSLRSAASNSYSVPLVLLANGSTVSGPTDKNAVRPAFHLNLAKVAAASTPATPKTNGDLKKYYDNGNELTFKLDRVDADRMTYTVEGTDMEGNAIGGIESAVSEDRLTLKVSEVGKYTVKVKLKDGEIWSDGSIEEKSYVFTVKYRVAPLIWAADVSNAVYRGEKQYFAVENYDPDRVQVQVDNGGALESIPTGDDAGKYGIGIVNAGSYNVIVTLKNTEYMEWTDVESASAKTLTFDVGKRDLKAYTGLQWSTEVYTAKVYDVELTECYEGDIDKIRIEGYYRKKGSAEETKIVGQITTKITEEGKKVAQVTLPRLAEQGEYECILKLTEGIESNGNYTLSFVNAFEVTNKKIELQDKDIVWTYANPNISDEFTEIGEKDGDGVYNVTYNGGKYTFKVDITKLSSDISESIEYEYIGGEESGKESNAEGAYYTARFKIKAKGGNTSITIVKDEFELKWRINKAKFDLSDAKWNYKGIYGFNEKSHSVELTLPAGLSAEYGGNSATNIGKYTAEVERIDIVDAEKRNNYIIPIPGKTDTYIGEVEWTLDWEIGIGKLELDWSRTLTKQDVNGRTFRYRAVSEETESKKLKGYEYYRDVNGAPSGEAMTLDEIVVVPEQTDRYWAVAILADKWVGKYEISEGSEKNRFTVGSTNEEVLIEMEQREYTYDGKVHGNEWKVVSGTENIIAKYYDRNSGEELSGIPTDAGEYVVRFEIEPEYADGYELAVSEIEYRIVAAEIEWELKGSPYTYDGKEHGVEIEITSGNYDVNKLNYSYYRGSEVNASNLLEGAPKDSGEYLLRVALSEEESRNYILKATQATFRIDKRQISAVWNTSGSIPVLSDPDGKYGEVIGYIYYDENGNRLEDGATLEVGKRYKVQAIIKGEHGSNYEFIGEDGEVLAEATVTEEKEFTVTDNNGGDGNGIGGIGSGNEPGDGSTPADFEGVLKKLKDWWQVIASGASIILILIFLAKAAGYAAKKKENKKSIERKYSAYYAVGLFGLSMMKWNIIAGVMMGAALLSFIVMEIEKKGYRKSLRELEDAKEEHARNREESLYMRMSGVNAGAQYGYANQPSVGIEDMRCMINEAVTAMLPNVQQCLPQQATGNDELMQMMMEQNARNEEELRRMNAENEEKIERLMAKLAEQSETKQAGIANEELIRQLTEQNAQNEERIRRITEENEKHIEKLMEKLSEQSAEKQAAATEASDRLVQRLMQSMTEKSGEKEVAADALTIDRLSKTVEELKSAVERMTESTNSGAERNSGRTVNVEGEGTIQYLLRNQELMMKQILELSSNKGGEKSIIIQQPAEKIVEKEIRVEVPVEKIIEKPVEKIVEVEKEVKVEVPAAKPTAPKKPVAPRLTLDEAYANLSKDQKKYFDTLKSYAMSKDKCKEKKSAYFILLGQSSVNPLVKLTIKKDTTVALFKMEDEYFKDIRRNAGSDGTKIKVKETELIVGDAQALDAAKEMIDLREDQIGRYQDYLKEQRSLSKK